MDRPLVDVVNEWCLRRLGARPNLERPTGYNDKINWLKLHDQMPEQVICSDKLLARAWVAERTDAACLLPLYQVARVVRRIDWDALPERFILKANHDSGGVRAVTDRSMLRRARRTIRRHLARTYGIHSGEWAYAHIAPRVFAEAYMTGAVTDYKFHCALGEILWVQIIADRASGAARETIVDPDHKPLPLHMDHKMIHEAGPPPRPGSWEGMKTLARALSELFRYVRVDLYDYGNRPVFGELTFWPLGGCYRTRDEPVFGDMLDLDIRFRRPMIASTVHEPLRVRARRLRRRIRDRALRWGAAVRRA